MALPDGAALVKAHRPSQPRRKTVRRVPAAADTFLRQVVQIQVQLFAVARQLTGQETLAVELPDKATVADLRTALASQAPELAGLMGQLKFAVDADYASDDAPLSATSRVACIPPVSGG